MEASLRAKVQAAVPNIETLLVLEDGDACNGSYTLVVVSPYWDGKGPLDRAREVNKAIEEEVKSMHALSVKCWTPAQWEKHRSKFE